MPRIPLYGRGWPKRSYLEGVGESGSDQRTQKLRKKDKRPSRSEIEKELTSTNYMVEGAVKKSRADVRKFRDGDGELGTSNGRSKRDGSEGIS